MKLATKLMSATLVALSQVAAAQVSLSSLEYCEGLSEDAFSVMSVHQNEPKSPRLVVLANTVATATDRHQLNQIIERAYDIPQEDHPWDRMAVSAVFARDEFTNCLMDFGLTVE